MAAVVILGSAFDQGEPFGPLDAVAVPTRRGPVTLHRRPGQPGWLLFRHGRPHTALPHQVDYRAQALALREVGCHALLITSSVGVLDPALPLYEPLLAGDLLMLDNRLPDGSACTLFDGDQPGPGHLLVQGGLFDAALSGWLRQRLGLRAEAPTFLYVGGPRTKTAAENRLAARLGAQVNSMTVGPEVVLANELEIPVAALLVGHKYSLPDAPGPPSEGVAASLERSRAATVRAVEVFLNEAPAFVFGNTIYRFSDHG